MRKLYFQMLVSLDGYFEGPGREIDWHNVDAEFNDYAITFLDRLDTLVFGRVTYEMMAAYWPTAAALKDDPLVAARMNRLEKIVVSRSLKKSDWHNTTIVGDRAADKIAQLKSRPGKDIAVFGSSDLALTLLGAGLIDELHILVNPLFLGAGKPLFKGLAGRLPLKLLGVETFRSGNVMLKYEPLAMESRKPPT
jgi:dihydrofolate reductase